jgi:spore cortex biosynthesis protein YabQ
VSLEVQFLTLAVMAGSGALLGLCFDTIGAVVREFRLHRAVQAVLDVLYWAAATLFVFRVLMAANYGEVRMFIFLGLAIGAILYALLLGRVMRRTTESVLRAIKRTARFLYNTVRRIVHFIIRAVRVLIIRPILFIYRLLARLILMIGGVVATLSIFLARLVIQWGRWFWKLIRRADNEDKDE